MTKRKANARESRISGRLALVTGANRGIGLAIARALAREGCNLIITARGERALAKTRAELEKLHVHVLAQPCDVRSPESVDYLFAIIRGLRQPLDILINNAGIAHPNRTVADLPYPTWMEVIDTNLNGLFLMTQAALAVMKRGGTIVNNLSVAAERVFPGLGRLQRLQARRPRLHRHAARGIAPQRHSRNRATRRRDGHRDMANLVAESAEAQNDVRRIRSSNSGRRAAAAGKHHRRENSDKAIHWHSLAKLVATRMPHWASNTIGRQLVR